MPLKPVDTAISVVVGPLLDETDGFTRETGVAWNAAGLDIDVILEASDGTAALTAVTPTSGAGDYDWAALGQGYYSLELPATSGASYNNDTEGILRVVGYATGVRPFSSPAYNVVPTAVYNSLVPGSDYLQVDAIQIEGADATDTLGTAQTGDTFARLGAPAGASVSADVAAVDAIVDAIKAKTDNLPGSFAKGVALSKFPILLVDSTDHVTPETGLTPAATISKDGGAFAAATNSVTEIGSGVYYLDLTAAEMTADTVVVKITASGADQRTITIVTDT